MSSLLKGTILIITSTVASMALVILNAQLPLDMPIF